MSIKIQKVTDASFRKYGRILTAEYKVDELIREMAKTPCPDDVIYIPSDAELEKLPVMKDFTDRLYGGLPVQIGYCNGHNTLLNAVEYHRSSEINVACTDLILLIGSQQDIEDDFTYDTSKIEAFLVPAGTMIEVYATQCRWTGIPLRRGTAQRHQSRFRGKTGGLRRGQTSHCPEQMAYCPFRCGN